jgi:hypothetical protein
MICKTRTSFTSLQHRLAMFPRVRIWKIVFLTFAFHIVSSTAEKPLLFDFDGDGESEA